MSQQDNSEILSAGVIDKSGNIIANKSSESFEKRFKGVSNLEGIDIVEP